MAPPWTEPKTVAEIQRLLKTGISQRAVARKTGVSRGTVLTIATGRHKPTKLKSKLPLADGEIQYPDHRRTPEWCSVCRAKVYMPCLACQIRALRGSKPPLPPPPKTVE